ncbi:flagellar assembly protein FliW [Opitutaceae bacterium EW11]|nr:flagellar assembly protein FliW [Opitutaceae bacterium EW11]
MKVSPDPYKTDLANGAPGTIRLPEGLVGFPEHQSFDLTLVPDQAPFMWMHLHGPDPLHFVVLEPNGIIPDYELELFDEDAEFLGIKDAADAAVLNIVTIRRNQPAAATVNLAGPIIINRRTGNAKQCVLANYARYSAHHPLVDSATAGR